MRARLIDRLTVTPTQYRRIAYVALAALALIVLMGAAVRLMDSGLGWPDWPRCYGKAVSPLQIHALIELGNRALSGIVGAVAVITAVLAFTRRPFTRDLAWLALTLAAGVIAQAVLGGFIVRQDLAPGFVMAHFGLSMVILIGAVGLAWRGSHEPGTCDRSTDRLAVWSVRALAPVGALAIFAGTAATAAGPHSGGTTGQRIHRLYFKGADTLTWVVHRHATIAALFGVLAIAVWLVHHRRDTSTAIREPLTGSGGAAGRAGASRQRPVRAGPSGWLGLVHVTLATLTWITVLWAVAAAGRLVPRTIAMREGEPASWTREPMSASAPPTR